jgi:transcriptional regulator with AAA-type ATPase domain
VKSKATIQPFATKIIMADDSNEEETGSQGTPQSTRNNEGSNGSYKRGAYRGNRSDKNSLQGNIAELCNNVYQYGTRDQGDRFTRTTEAIAAYAGREYSKEMRLLVKNQKENEPKEPVMPDKEEATSPFVMKKYEANRVETILLQERKKDTRSTKQRYL